jgi:hypothetical protein
MKTLTVIGLALVAGVITAIIPHQSAAQETNVFMAVTNPVVSIAPVVVKGAEAVIVAEQLLSVTNANGLPILSPAVFSGQRATIVVNVRMGTNGLPVLIKAQVVTH